MAAGVGRWPCDSYGGVSSCGGASPAPPDPSTGSLWFTVPFSYDDAPDLFLGLLEPNDLILESRISITTPFNHPLTEITLGPDADPDQLLTSQEIDPTEVGMYQSTHDLIALVADSVRVRIFPNGSTQGGGVAYLNILRPS